MLLDHILNQGETRTLKRVRKYIQIRGERCKMTHLQTERRGKHIWTLDDKLEMRGKATEISTSQLMNH